ncbi:MAG TPA: molybdate ABC transporter substrate-binding protein, partial [Lachnospiraceae bacterium]|nr:molybdate ABC transporter substrate-binding protein [Lachnospiraceae bacterium]
MKTHWKETFRAVLLCTALASGCVLPAAAGDTEQSQENPGSGKTELTVFAAASMTETLTKLAETYEQKHPEITISFNFDSSGTLETQILEGSDCDLFVSAAQKQMNELDKDAAPDTNPDGNDELLAGTRVDLLENKVALAVPDGNPKNIRSF